MVCILYWVALDGGYRHDDYVNIVENPLVQIQDISLDSLQQSTINIRTGLPKLLNRSLARLSFSLNYLATGLNPFWFKLTNLLIHLLTGLTVYWVLHRLLQAWQRVNVEPDTARSAAIQQWLPLLAAVVWLVHPLHVSTVMYPVQRMAQLASLFTLLGFGVYVTCRLRQLASDTDQGHRYLALALLVIWPCAMMSKENAAVLPLLCLVAEVTVLRFARLSPLLIWAYRALYLSIVLLVLYFLMWPDYILAGYASRDFSLSQRLMTEARVLWIYLSLLVVPDTANMSLYQDDIPLSLGLMQPWSTSLALLAWGMVVPAAIMFRRRFPILSFSILWYLVAHLVESSVLSLEIAYEHRNYLPSVGVCLGVVYGLFLLFYRYEQLAKRGAVAAVLLIGLLMIQLFVRNQQWSSEFGQAYTEAMHHPASYRTNSEVARLYLAHRKVEEAQVFAHKALISERPYANIYIMLLSIEHIVNGKVSEQFYREMEDHLAHGRAYISIINQLIAYMDDATRNGWETPQQLVALVQALQLNPNLQSDYAQGNIHLTLATLSSAMGDDKALRFHAQEAFRRLPEHISIAKLHISFLIVDGKLKEALDLVEDVLSKPINPVERKDFEQLLADIKAM